MALMTSALAEPCVSRGSQRPRISLVPHYATTTGPEAIELAASAGLFLDPWQQLVLIGGLGQQATGQWSAFEVGLNVPRQNGKDGILEARELAGLFLIGERLIVHTAHRADTAFEHFTRLEELIGGREEFSRRVRHVSHTNGKEGITFQRETLRERSGHTRSYFPRITFRTRTKGGGRGWTGDLVIVNEAMEASEASMGALFFTLSAIPNPQIWFAGSAVNQEVHTDGVVFTRVRERAIAGDDPSLAYFEWSAPGDIETATKADAANREWWAMANPAEGIRISEGQIVKELQKVSLRNFLIERLGMGDYPSTEEEPEHLLSPETWKAAEDPRSAIAEGLALGLDVTKDRSWASISSAGVRSDGHGHVELVDRRRGTKWLPDRVAALAVKHGASTIALDARGPAASLLPDLTDALIALEVEIADKPGDRGVHIVLASGADMAQACGLFYDGVTECGIHHGGQPELTAAVEGARPKGGDTWVWSRKDSTADIAPVVSCTLAWWASRTQLAPEKPFDPADYRIERL